MSDPTCRRTIKVATKGVFAEVPETYTVSPEQFKFYHDHGYLVISRLFDFATLYSYKKRFSQIANGLVDKGFMTMVKEKALLEKGLRGEQVINKFQDIAFDEVFGTYFEYPRLLDVVSQFIGVDNELNTPPGVNMDPKYGDNLRAQHTMIINKPPGTGEHPPHQDIFYFPFRPAHKIIAAWTAVDEVTSDNGALYVIPGSHKLGKIYEHSSLMASTKLYHGIVDGDKVAPLDQRVTLQMAPGDTVFFHPLLVHGSGSNVTKHYRKAISCHFANSGCTYIDVEGTVHGELAREVEDNAKKRGIDISFQDVWRYKSKQVKGVKCSL